MKPTEASLDSGVSAQRVGAWGEMRGWVHVGWTKSRAGTWHAVGVYPRPGAVLRPMCQVGSLQGRGSGSGRIYPEPERSGKKCKRCVYEAVE